MNGTRKEGDARDAAGARYSKFDLFFYDLWVLCRNNRFFWRCPTACLLEFYNQNVAGNHLDVGVGTGYFLHHCRFPGKSPRVALMDSNPGCLAKAARRIARYRPERYQCNVLDEDDVRETTAGIERFDSIGMNYLLHCLRGTIATKAAVFDHLRPLLKPGGVLFGSTLLAIGVQRTPAAERLMSKYQQEQRFHNAQDSMEELRKELKKRFATADVLAIGCAALFRAQS
ncbi:MAG: class I SAM-dependent methyltransferase [Thermoguttaceae bacterium]|jgi:SAM-dependent methyltransferase